jgi:hypothetical protein
VEQAHRAVRSPTNYGRETRAGFYFKLEHEDGTPADPPVLHTAVPNWQAGGTIPLGADRTLRVFETRFVGDEPVLVVERA